MRSPIGSPEADRPGSWNGRSEVEPRRLQSRIVSPQSMPSQYRRGLEPPLRNPVQLRAAFRRHHIRRRRPFDIEDSADPRQVEK